MPTVRSGTWTIAVGSVAVLFAGIMSPLAVTTAVLVTLAGALPATSTVSVIAA